MSFRTEQIKNYIKQIQIDCECILQDIDEFEETKQYDEVFSVSRALERIEDNTENAKFHNDELDLECEDV
jgi:hypothetical protein